VLAEILIGSQLETIEQAERVRDFLSSRLL
jgi:hypothetical protein